MSLDAETTTIIENIVIETLEIDAGTLRPDASFSDEYSADSLRMIEVVASIEKRMKIRIDQARIAEMTDLNGVLKVVAESSL